MSAIALPSWFVPASFSLAPKVNQRVFAAPFGGSEQVIDLLNDRWLMSVQLPPMTHARAADAEAFFASLRGAGNTVALYHFKRPQPRGTARGTMLLNGAVSQGASQLVIDGISPGTGTLLAGDMLGVGGLLLQVAADATAVAGAITVTLANRVRTALADNAPVTWQQPTAPFRLAASPLVQYLPGLATVGSVDFAEAIA